MNASSGKSSPPSKSSSCSNPRLESQKSAIKIKVRPFHYVRQQKLSEKKSHFHCGRSPKLNLLFFPFFPSSQFHCDGGDKKIHPDPDQTFPPLSQWQSSQSPSSSNFKSLLLLQATVRLNWLPSCFQEDSVGLRKTFYLQKVPPFLELGRKFLKKLIRFFFLLRATLSRDRKLRRRACFNADTYRAFPCIFRFFVRPRKSFQVQNDKIVFPYELYKKQKDVVGWLLSACFRYLNIDFPCEEKIGKFR